MTGKQGHRVQVVRFPAASRDSIVLSVLGLLTTQSQDIAAAPRNPSDDKPKD